MSFRWTRAPGRSRPGCVRMFPWMAASSARPRSSSTFWAASSLSTRLLLRLILASDERTEDSLRASALEPGLEILDLSVDAVEALLEIGDALGLGRGSRRRRGRGLRGRPGGQDEHGGGENEARGASAWHPLFYNTNRASRSVDRAFLRRFPERSIGKKPGDDKIGPMTSVSRSFQVFVKPAGAACNLACRYCYYLGKGPAGPGAAPALMPEDLLEAYIAQHIAASPDEIIRFSWHGGEPTVLGLDYFRRIVEPSNAGSARRAGRSSTACRPTARSSTTSGAGSSRSKGSPSGSASTARGRSTIASGSTRDGRSSFDDAMRGFEILRRHGVADRHPLRRRRPQRRPSPRGLSLFQRDRRLLPDLPPSRRAAARRARAESAPRPSRPRAGAISSAPFSTSGSSATSAASRSRSSRRRPGRPSARSTRSASSGRSAATSRSSSGTGMSTPAIITSIAEHRLGNIHETPLAELLESPAQRAFGRAKRETLPRVCRTCEVLDMCHGECPKNRFVLAPDGGRGPELSLRRLQDVLRPRPAVRRRGRGGVAPRERLALELVLQEGDRALPGELGGLLVVGWPRCRS